MMAVGRLGQADDIAATAVHPVSDESAWTAGSILTIDGDQTSMSSLCPTPRKRAAGVVGGGHRVML